MSRYKKFFLTGVGVLLTSFFIFFSIVYFDLSYIKLIVKNLLNEPGWFILISIGYAASFILRALAWWLYLNKRLLFKDCLDAIWYSLFINHLLPFKVGDVVRGYYITKITNRVNWDESLHSVIVLRAVDIITLILFSGLGLFLLFGKITFNVTFFLYTSIVIIGVGLFFLMKGKWSQWFSKHINLVKEAFLGKYSFIIICCILFSWILEGVVVFGLASIFPVSLSYLRAVWANSLTVGGSVFQIAPGGLATYESIMTFALTNLNIAGEESYSLALLSHGYKFLFSYIVGVYVMISSPLRVTTILREIKKRRRSLRK